MVKTMLQELSDQAEQRRVKKILANISPDQYILKLDEEREKRREVEKALRLACEELAGHLLIPGLPNYMVDDCVETLVRVYKGEVKNDGRN